MKQLIRKHALAIVLLVLLILLFVRVMVLQKDIEEMRFDVTGTYCSSIGPVDDADYFVFEQGGIYHRYRQFSDLETGAYSVDGTIVTLLGEGEKRYLIFSDKLLYYFDPGQNEWTAYEKISPTSLFINVGELTGE